MKKILTSPVLLISLFVFFFVIINIYIIFKFEVEYLFNSYITIYVFWFIIILILKLISSKMNFEKDDRV